MRGRKAKHALVTTDAGKYPALTVPARRGGNPNWRPGETPPGARPYQPGESGGGYNAPPQRFSSLVRAATDQGGEMVAFMLAVMRGDVERLLPPSISDERLERIAVALKIVEAADELSGHEQPGKVRTLRKQLNDPVLLAQQVRRQRARAKKQRKAAETALTERQQSLAKFRSALMRAVDVELTVDARMRAARWLADRGFGKAPITIEVKEGESVVADLSALTPEEVRSFLALLEKVRVGQARPVGSGTTAAATPEALHVPDPPPAPNV